MLRDQNGKRLWIETQTGGVEPVESNAQLHSRKRGQGTPDWWVVAKDSGWRPASPVLRKDGDLFRGSVKPPKGGGCVSKPNHGGEFQACTPDGRYTFDRGNGSGGPAIPPPPAQDKEARLIWSQSRGTLETVEGLFLDQSYSGAGSPDEKGAGRNNPAREGEKDIGPIPQGNWRIEKVADEKYRGRLTPPVFRLIPLDDGTRERVKAMGRDPDTFLIHGDKPGGNASTGCIIMDKPMRDKLLQYNKTILHVGE